MRMWRRFATSCRPRRIYALKFLSGWSVFRARSWSACGCRKQRIIASSTTETGRESGRDETNGRDFAQRRQGRREDGERGIAGAEDHRARWGGSRAGRIEEDSGTLREGAEVLDQRVSPERGPSAEWGDVQRVLRRDGGGEGHRIFQPVRASLAAVFWQGARGVFAEQEGDWLEQGGAIGEYVCAAIADSGAHDQPDRAGSRGQNRAAGSWGDH